MSILGGIYLKNIFRDYMVSSPEATLFCDAQGRIHFWNFGCQNLFGWKSEETGDISIRNLIDPEFHADFKPYFDAVRKGSPLTISTRCLTKDGKIFEASVTIGCINSKNSLFYCIVKDISDIIDVQELHKDLAMFPDTNPDFIIEWDRFKGIAYYNQSVKEFLHEAGLGQSSIDRILPPNFENYMRRLVGTENITRDVEVQYRDNIFSYTFTPFRLDNNKILIIGKDITIKKHLEKEIDSAYDRTSGILDFIEGILREFRYIDLDENIDLKPVANMSIRDLIDSSSHNPSHLFIALENDENVLEGHLYYKRHGELLTTSDSVIIKRSDLKSIVSGKNEILFANWYDESGDISEFQENFPATFRNLIPEIRNFASYRITGESSGIFIAFNYAKEVTEYDAETIKGLAVAVGTLYSIETQFKARERAQFITMTKMAEMAEKRDLETGEHLWRIRHYAVILAECLSKDPKYKTIITPQYINRLYNSAPLHDIGKIGIPDIILQKPGKFTEDEFEKMKEHTIIGGKILEGPKFLEMAKEIAYCHHEKFNGSGYPNGISGTDIPLSARIIAVADVYDAMTSKRVYKDAVSHEQTVEEIENSSGTHFDPEIVDAFISVEKRFEEVKKACCGNAKKI